MSTTVVQPRLRVAFAGTFAVRLEERVRAHLGVSCDLIRADELEIDLLLSVGLDTACDSPWTQVAAEALWQSSPMLPRRLPIRPLFRRCCGHQSRSMKGPAGCWGLFRGRRDL